MSACPTKNLPNIDDLGKPTAVRVPQPMMVPTAAALKMGVGFPLKNIPSGRGERVMSGNSKGKLSASYSLIFYKCIFVLSLKIFKKSLKFDRKT